MQTGILIFFAISLASYGLEHSGSSSTSSSHSPRSPRDELQIVGNVERVQEFDKKNRVIKELYRANLASNSVISVAACYQNKNKIVYDGAWKRNQQPERTMEAECARTYFDKLKRAYLQNTPLL